MKTEVPRHGTLEKVKANLILQHSEDDALLQDYIKAAVAYAESYQKSRKDIMPKTPCRLLLSRLSLCCRAIL